ncbi:MAG: type VI secretion system protein TssA [Alphaproteobacteria bacterium]
MVSFNENLLEKALSPLSKDLPSGVSLRYDPFYDAIREARRNEDPLLPQGVWESETKKADWGQVSNLCLQGLLERSKDLQLMAWLLESWTALEGVDGLARGLQWLHRLSETFWTSLHPELDEDGASLRLASYVWLDDKLPQMLLTVAISKPEKGNLRAFSLAEWFASQRLETISRKQTDPEEFLKQAVEEKGEASPQSVWRSIRATPPVFYQQLKEKMMHALDELQALEDFLKTMLQGMKPSDLPSFFALHKQLNQIISLCDQWGSVTYPVQNLKKILLEDQPSPENFETLPNKPETHDENSEKLEQPRDSSRQEMLETLKTISDALIKEDPNSPLSLLLKQAILWRDKNFMDLFELFREDSQSFQSIMRLLANNK